MSLSDDEVAELRKLLEVEKIRKVIVLYSQLMDSRDWDAMAGLYTEDAVGEWGPYGRHEGREAIREVLVAGHPDRVPYDGFHITTNYWIEMTGNDTAMSRSYLTDMFPLADTGKTPVIWYSTYENDYRKVQGEWKIARSTIEWLWPERIVSEGFPRAMPTSSLG